MAATAGYELRPPIEADLEAVGDVLRAEDPEGTVLGADFVREYWSRADFDPATDAWVAVDGAGAAVAYGHATREGEDVVESWGVVHPEHRGRGIGSSLLDLIEERAAELAGPTSYRFRHAIDAEDRAAAAMLETRGMRPVRHFWHMRIDLIRPIEPGPAPGGIEIHALEPGDDLEGVHGVLAEAFADDWGYHPEPFDRWVEDQTASPSHDVTLWLLARDDVSPVGALTASVLGDHGWVDELGVLPTHRGRGIAASMLRRSFAAFAGRGLGRVMLNVDAENPTGATALYERVGMRVVRRWDLWERERSPSSWPLPELPAGS